MPRGGARPGAGRKRSEKPAASAVDAAPSLNAAESKKRRGNPIGVGRPLGALNKATAALKEYAGQYTTDAIDALVKIARASKTPPPVKVAAWREVLDRGNGKAPQAITGEGGGPVRVAAIVDELHP